MNSKLAPYHLVPQEQPGYVHATVTGTHSAKNALRFLTESFEACSRSGCDALLVEFNLSGPSIGTSSIFDVVSKRTKEATRMRKIAYVDSSERDLEKKQFAETVALNRGVNVRLFADMAAAQRWLSEDLPPKKSRE